MKRISENSVEIKFANQESTNMRKIGFYFILIFAFVACKSKYEKNLEKMAATVKQNINDNAFKNNITIDFLTYEPIGYDTVPQRAYDVSLINLYIKEIELHGNRFDTYSKKKDIEFNHLKLSKLVGDKSGMDDAREEIEKLSSLQEKELDIIKGINNKIKEIDSIANNRENPEKLYQLKLFIKSVEKEKSGDTHNTMDTLYFLFDKNLQLMSLPDISIDFAE